MIGVDPHPFADIPRKQRHHKRYARFAARIRAEEDKLLDHLASVNNDLERRRPDVRRSEWCCHGLLLA